VLDYPTESLAGAMQAVMHAFIAAETTKRLDFLKAGELVISNMTKQPKKQLTFKHNDNELLSSALSPIDPVS